MKHSASSMIPKAHVSKSQMKTVLITSLDIKGTVHFQSFQKGQPINQAYYVEVLKRLREAPSIKRPKHWPNDSILHHNSAPAPKALFAKQFLAQKSITEMKLPSCSPDLWLLPKMKSVFKDIEDIQKKCDDTESCSTAGVPDNFQQ
jgi:hypothetical protein